MSIEDDYRVPVFNQFSVHLGIVNFFPVMFGLIDVDSKLLPSLQALADKSTMLSNSGVRSLSKKDQFYQYRSNYWRGAVWVNVNYLVLRGLFQNYMGIRDIWGDSTGIPKTKGIESGADLYQSIRKGLVRTVYKNWEMNHLFWEQYDDSTGLGKYTSPFTGWTTLVLLIVHEIYV